MQAVLPQSSARLWPERGDLAPILLISAIAAIALVWNMALGLRWAAPLSWFLAAPAVCFVLTAVYRTVRPEPAIAEASLYVGLWFVYPVFGTQLTYLANHLAWPLQDGLFNRWDLALGFRWIDWAVFIAAHPLLEKVQLFAYESWLWQPAVSVVIFSFWGPKGRNSEFLTAILLALMACIAINLFLPAVGPPALNGLRTQTADIVHALRGGENIVYPYTGIIQFPSFHTVMALLYIAAHRGNRYTFPVVLAWNSVMISAIPFAGAHYLVDLPAGAVIAVCALMAAQRLLRAKFFQTQAIS